MNVTGEPRIPISLIVDDPCPGLHLYYTHAARRNPAALTGDGRPLLRFIPNGLLREFIAVTEEFGLRGKFSVVPQPSCAGSINSSLDGVPPDEMRGWLDLVRTRVAPCFDITPEMITHDWAIDLDTMQPLTENEHDWSQHQDQAALRRYIAYALGELKSARFDATGVTSPWAFGLEVEDSYARAVLEAEELVFGRSQTWYFLRSSDAPGTQAEVMILEPQAAGPPRSCVSVIATVGDMLWRTMDYPGADDEYIGSIADQYLTLDGTGGRIAAALADGCEIVLCTHWQSLFSNGTHAGLRALAEVARRVRETLGDRVEWLRCSELAAQAVARKVAAL